MDFIVYVILIWNLVVFLLYGLDKLKAKKKKYRISEKTLITCAYLFGGMGALLGMMFFNHKTKHLKFIILIPLSLVLNVLAWMILKV